MPYIAIIESLFIQFYFKTIANEVTILLLGAVVIAGKIEIS